MTPDALTFARDLARHGVAMFTAPPGGREFARPPGWQATPPSSAEAVIAAHRPPDALCAVLGALAVVDVDTKADADIEATRAALDAAGIAILAEVATPSGGRHFYIAGHPDLTTVHAQEGRDGIEGLPGVEILSHRTNAFLPGTQRPKYGGRGYGVITNRLDLLDPDNGARAAEWVAANRARRHTPQAQPAPRWSGEALGERERRYLDAVLARQADEVAQTRTGRNNATYEAALKLGSYITGAGLDRATAEHVLVESARANGLLADDGPHSVAATIRSGLDTGARTPKAVPPPRDPLTTTRPATVAPAAHDAQAWTRQEEAMNPSDTPPTNDTPTPPPDLPRGRSPTSTT